MRLNRFLASSTDLSRRKCDQLILSGRVTINGKPLDSIGIQIDPDTDSVEVDGKPVILCPKKVYMFYKPINVLSTMKDIRGRKAVNDFFSHLSFRVFPVGRLDKNTTGLLIMTSDGDLANDMIHPSKKVEKEYIAVIGERVRKEDLITLGASIEILGKATKQCKVEIVSVKNQKTVLRFVLKEGRKRQIRELIKRANYHLLHLHRRRIGELILKGIKPGEYRELTKEEIQLLIR